jgi:hypothetical protein
MNNHEKIKNCFLSFLAIVMFNKMTKLNIDSKPKDEIKKINIITINYCGCLSFEVKHLKLKNIR